MAQQLNQRATVFHVAEYILSKYPMGISSMKLHKLLYYAQGWNLAFTGEHLFEESIQAWKSGPVIPVLYALHGENAYSLYPGDINKMLRDPETCARIEAAYAREFWAEQTQPVSAKTPRSV